MKDKITVIYTNEFGTVSKCTLEQEGLTKPDIVNWFMFTALLGIGFTSPLEGVDYGKSENVVRLPNDN